jgi:hypothetical protein
MPLNLDSVLIDFIEHWQQEKNKDALIYASVYAT